MDRLTHISVWGLLGATALVGCFKKAAENTEPAAPTLAALAVEGKELTGAEVPFPQPKLSIADPLVQLPTIGSWRPISRVGAPFPCPDTTKVFWTGSNLLVFGQLLSDTKAPVCKGVVSLWDPATDTWRTLPDAGATNLIGPALEGSEVFLSGSLLFVLVPKEGESRSLDLTTQLWKPAPPWITQAIWPPFNGTDGKTGRSLDGHPDVLTAPKMRPYAVMATGLVVWLENAGKVFDWQTGVPKDLPPIAWSTTPPGTGWGEWENYGLASNLKDQILLVYRQTTSQAQSASPKSTFAVTSLLSSPTTWKLLSPPLLVDDAGRPKCAETIEFFSTLVDSKVVFIGIDGARDEPKPLRTCLSTVDSPSGILTHTTHLTLSQIASRPDGSYEYLDLSIGTHVLSGRRIVYRMKRDGGLVSISDDASQGFAFQGHEERLLAFDSSSGSVSLTPPLTGTGQLDKIYIVGTDRGIIAWGGHKPKTDGSEESLNEGVVLDWPQ